MAHHTCKTCGSAFATKNKLNVHFRDKHKEKATIKGFTVNRDRGQDWHCLEEQCWRAHSRSGAGWNSADAMYKTHKSSTKNDETWCAIRYAIHPRRDAAAASPSPSPRSPSPPARGARGAAAHDFTPAHLQRLLTHRDQAMRKADEIEHKTAASIRAAIPLVTDAFTTWGDKLDELRGSVEVDPVNDKAKRDTLHETLMVYGQRGNSQGTSTARITRILEQADTSLRDYAHCWTEVVCFLDEVYVDSTLTGDVSFAHLALQPSLPGDDDWPEQLETNLKEVHSFVLQFARQQITPKQRSAGGVEHALVLAFIAYSSAKDTSPGTISKPLAKIKKLIKYCGVTCLTKGVPAWCTTADCGAAGNQAVLFPLLTVEEYLKRTLHVVDAVGQVLPLHTVVPRHGALKLGDKWKVMRGGSHQNPTQVCVGDLGAMVEGALDTCVQLMESVLMPNGTVPLERIGAALGEWTDEFLRESGKPTLDRPRSVLQWEQRYLLTMMKCFFADATTDSMNLMDLPGMAFQLDRQKVNTFLDACDTFTQAMAVVCHLGVYHCARGVELLSLRVCGGRMVRRSVSAEGGCLRLQSSYLKQRSVQGDRPTLPIILPKSFSAVFGIFQFFPAQLRNTLVTAMSETTQPSDALNHFFVVRGRVMGLLGLWGY